MATAILSAVRFRRSATMIDKLTDRSRDINLGEKKDRAQPSSVNHRYCRSTKGRGSKADRGSARLKVYCGETFLSLLRETGVEEDNEELFHNFFSFFFLSRKTWMSKIEIRANSSSGDRHFCETIDTLSRLLDL